MNKKRKILWASPTCLLDTSSGFALGAREILIQLSKYDYEVEILSATIFDNISSFKIFKKDYNISSISLNKFLKVKDDILTHKIFVTKSIVRDEMQSFEEAKWFIEYLQTIEVFKPDIVFFYRNGLLELSLAREAKIRNISTVVYLVNPSYRGKLWLRDVDLIISDSIATAKMYKEKEDYDITSVGVFLSKEKYISKKHTRTNLLFINPVLKKGAIFVIQLALYLEEIGSDITIEIVSSGDNWQNLLKHVSASFGKQKKSLTNILLTQSTSDMKSIYERARVLLVPSFWFESAGRVIVEAQLNGIPVIGSSSGGIPEMVGDGGFILEFPKEFMQEPYNKLADKKTIEKVASLITKLYDDEEFYNLYSTKALQYANTYHDVDKNTNRVIEAFEDLILR